MNSRDTHSEKQATNSNSLTSEVLDLEKIRNIFAMTKTNYATASPFPHAIFDHFISNSVGAQVAQELDGLLEHSNYFRHFNSKKYACNDLTVMGPTTRKLIETLQSKAFIALVSELSGIKNLLADPTLDGGGVHMIGPGGFLNIHTDYLSHAKFNTWSRQINLLVYLNEDWKEEFNGQLELRDADGKNRVQVIGPEMGRCVIFTTRDKSYHGHPTPLAIPEGKLRKSIALYYFVDEGRPLNLKPTDYINLPEDGISRRLANRLDKFALKILAFSKRHLGMNEKSLPRLIKKFFG